MSDLFLYLISNCLNFALFFFSSKDFYTFVCLRDCTMLNCLLAMLCQNDTALGGVSVSLVQIGCILVASSSEIPDFYVRVCFCVATCVTLVIRLFILVACPLQAPIAGGETV